MKPRTKLVYDLTGWKPPDRCVGCKVRGEEFIMDYACPVHGSLAGPVIRGDDFPPLVEVPE